MTALSPHQYIERNTLSVVDEPLFGDKIINHIYSNQRENSSAFFRMLTSRRASKLLAYFNYDIPFGDAFTGGRRLLNKLGVDLSECMEPPDKLDTARKVFERKIKYWEKRPMPSSSEIVVSPADSKMIAGSFARESLLFIKEKFFHYDELIGYDKWHWLDIFKDGDYAIFRLTPEKYHYNHAPVSGRVIDIYEIDGSYHSCNPGAVVSLVTPFSKNKRVVTVIETNIAGGSGVGKVIMIEIAALMIGDIVQCYSRKAYDDPQAVRKGMMLLKGQPKSLYRPGSSVDVLIFEKDSVHFSEDILLNLNRKDIKTRYSSNFSQPLVETEVAVRSTIAKKKSGELK